jgi:UDP-N-acetylglucosamine acyltransferase
MKAHPTAIVSSKAKIAGDTVIGPYAVIEDDVTIQPGCMLHAGAYICSGTTIGKNCIIYMGACLGNQPQDLAYKDAKSYLVVGDKNVFREYTTIHRGTADGTATVVGNNNYFMCGAHVAHNCKIGNNVIICNNALLAGYVEVEDAAFISAACLIHQFVRIGTLAMIAGGVRLNKDFPPYMSTGADNIVESYNIIGLRRAGLNTKTRDAIKQAYRILYRDNLNTSNAIERLSAMEQSQHIKHLIAFIRSSKRGVCTARSNRT